MTYEEINRDKCKTYLTLIKVGASYSQLAEVSAEWTYQLKYYLNPASPQGSLHPKRLPFFDYMLSFIPEYWKLYDILSQPKSYLSRLWVFNKGTPQGQGHLFFAEIYGDISVYDLRNDDIPKSLSRLSRKFKMLPRDSYILYKESKVILFYNKKEWKARNLSTTILERVVETKAVFGESRCVVWNTTENMDKLGCYFYSQSSWLDNIIEEGQ